MALPVRPRHFFPITPAGGVRLALLSSGWWWSAFALRFGWIIVAHTYKFKTFDDNFSFGWEMGRIGRALAQGQGFSNPFNETTGPTAWEPPLYPFLDRRGLPVVWGLHPRLGAGAAGPEQFFFRADLYSYFPDCQTMLQRKTGDLDCLAVGRHAACHVLVHAVGLGDQSGGAAARTHFLADSRPRRARRADTLDRVRTAVGNRRRSPTLPCWRSCRLPDFGRGTDAGNAVSLRWVESRCRCWYSSPASLPGLRATTGPLGLMSLRSNFGAELRIGNGPGADGTWREYLHPTQNVYQMRLYRATGRDRLRCGAQARSDRVHSRGLRALSWAST